MGAPDRAPTRETVQRNGPGGLRGLVALALALAIPPCASGATNVCGGTALGPLDAVGTESLSIAVAPIAGGQELQPWELASTGSTAVTPATLHEGIASGAIPTITLVTTTTAVPITTLTLVTTTLTLPVTTLTLPVTTTFTVLPVTTTFNISLTPLTLPVYT